ncbi:MAG: ABC transporter ATP-binding protein [Candidatus Ranarchaeia archaeon]
MGIKLTIPRGNLYSDEIIYDIRHLTKYFPIRTGFFESLFSRTKLEVHAVEDISFTIRRGEILAAAGESGCGKTTTGRTMIRLENPTKGEVIFEGVDLAKLKGNQLREYRKKIQVIQQDPYEALNPKLSVYDTLSEPININKIPMSFSEKREHISRILEEVHLTPVEDYFYRYPHQLSGGQRQRVAVARALVLNPKFIFADEPVSMLDVSVRAGVLNLLLRFRKQYNLTYFFVTHDLAVASYIADRIAIMYLGRIVEIGDAIKISRNAVHPYTITLISAVPTGDPTVKKRIVKVEGEVPSPIYPPPGCPFNTRCPYATDICYKEFPEFVGDPLEHAYACHHPQKLEDLLEYEPP